MKIVFSLLKREEFDGWDSYAILGHYYDKSDTVVIYLPNLCSQEFSSDLIMEITRLLAHEVTHQWVRKEDILRDIADDIKANGGKITLDFIWLEEIIAQKVGILTYLCTSSRNYMGR